MTVVTFTGVDTSGVNGAGAVGATGTGSGASGAPTASLVTTRNNSWVFGVGNDWDGAIARTAGANQTVVHQLLLSSGDTFWVQKQNSTTPLSGTTVTINDTAPTADRYNLSAVEILPATGASQPTFTVSGTISGSGGASATVTLSGAANATVTANASGVYNFTGVSNGVYTVTPSKTGFSFTPVNQPVTVNGANVTANFATQLFTVSGNISGATSAGVTVVVERHSHGYDNDRCVRQLHLQQLKQRVVHRNAEPQWIYVHSTESERAGERSQRDWRELYFCSGLHHLGERERSSGYRGYRCIEWHGQRDNHHRRFRQLRLYCCGQRIVHGDAQQDGVYLHTTQPEHYGERC